ncbi:hypothetical protein WSK_2816 [Novosphingobium sp. Rr 2-17]|uniref:CHAP domain-containing protein n=1 Tax=Novosphingobium sp. Rr 2-17 TaxID=555793 RepID=UPI0002699891|nr:CHAP domain-containing protein [Novosphingobium sp. Rr 2-17]EIZ78768.1 hypothetical protein WSK_2816 [Novosphingobium sp. Rr 2-17]
MFASAPAFARLQCAPYAREVSGIDIHGNAHTWWQQAEGIYQKGSAPKEQAVMVFRSTPAMRYGHVAVVSKIVDARHVLLDHANWSRPGMIEHQSLAEDVSSAGDWSEVRVWNDPSHSLGLRANPVFGFIYKAQPQSPSVPVLAPAPKLLIVSATPQPVTAPGEVLLVSSAG